MMFEGWVEPNPYDYSIDNNNVFTVLYKGEVVYTSRAFRLKVQAEAKAKEWIQRALKQIPEGVTLDVQNVSVDAGAIFGKIV